jgi:hypothetical protein
MISPAVQTPRIGAVPINLPRIFLARRLDRSVAVIALWPIGLRPGSGSACRPGFPSSIKIMAAATVLG